MSCVRAFLMVCEIRWSFQQVVVEVAGWCFFLLPLAFSGLLCNPLFSLFVVRSLGSFDLYIGMLCWIPSVYIVLLGWLLVWPYSLYADGWASSLLYRRVPPCGRSGASCCCCVIWSGRLRFAYSMLHNSWRWLDVDSPDIDIGLISDGRAWPGLFVISCKRELMNGLGMNL